MLTSRFGKLSVSFADIRWSSYHPYFLHTATETLVGTFRRQHVRVGALTKLPIPNIVLISAIVVDAQEAT